MVSCFINVAILYELYVIDRCHRFSDIPKIIIKYKSKESISFIRI